MRATIFGISGCTNAGKTTISKNLIKKIVAADKPANVGYICQDDYFKQKEDVRAILDPGTDKIVHYHYDEAEAVDEDRMVADILRKSCENDVIIVEGNMLCEMEKVVELMDFVLFITLDADLCRQRRVERCYEPPDSPGYFEEIVWPCYVQHFDNAVLLQQKQQQRHGGRGEIDVSFVSGSKPLDELLEIAYQKMDSCLRFLIRIQTAEIDTKVAEQFVVLPQCGAVSTFVGTTRNNFNGKEVTSLEYECYESMAYSELRKVCQETREKYPFVERIAAIHRIGKVEVGEASVVISTSSPHRKDAIEATSYAIDILKSRVPIFKKEVYADGTKSWKENCEFHQLEGDLNHDCLNVDVC